MNNKWRLAGHPDEDVFEAYIFGRLSETSVSGLEEHLLICEQCQVTLVETDEYVRVMKAATSAYAWDVGASVVSPRSIGKPDEGLQWNAAAAAILLLTCLTALLSWKNPGGDPKALLGNNITI